MLQAHQQWGGRDAGGFPAQFPSPRRATSPRASKARPVRLSRVHCIKPLTAELAVLLGTCERRLRRWGEGNQGGNGEAPRM